ncbi:MAG: hypothetical protein ACRC7R_06655 [Sarcina sp.]
MKHNSKNNNSKDLDHSNTSDKDDVSLIQKNEKTISSDSFTEQIPNNEEEKNFSEFLSYVSNAYYYTGKGAYSLNIKAIVFTILGVVVLISSALLYINNKSNFNIYIGATIGILLLIIALIQFTYKKN